MSITLMINRTYILCPICIHNAVAGTLAVYRTAGLIIVKQDAALHQTNQINFGF